MAKRESALVFVSYAHEDTPWLERLQVFLKPLMDEGVIELWADTRILPGQCWKVEIDGALRRACAAILLVSADFLASDFIRDEELPTLLRAARDRGVRVLPVIVSHSRFSRTKGLKEFQAVNNPEAPIDNLPKSLQNKVWLDVTYAVEDALEALPPADEPPEPELPEEVAPPAERPRPGDESEDGLPPDLFISYNPIDDQPLRRGDGGWVTQFRTTLEVRLAMLLGEKPRLRCGSHNGGASPDLHALHEALLFVPVLSPGYQRSERCREELRTFREAAREEPAFGEEPRLLGALKTPLTRGAEELRLNGHPVYKFFEERGEDGEFREFEPAFGATWEARFIERVDDLACAIWRSLSQVPDRVRESRRAAIAKAAPSLPSVYLAEAGNDLRDERESVRGELLAMGYRVAPEQYLPERECRPLVRRLLEQSVLSVHLVGEHPGFLPDGEDTAAVELQYREARDQEKPAVVWRPPGSRVDARDRSRHGEFLRQLETQPDLLEEPLAELVQLIRERLKAPTATAGAAGDQPGGVYLLHHGVDERSKDLDSVKSCLVDLGFPVHQPDGRRASVERIGSGGGVLLYWGAADANWVDSQLSQLRKSRGYERSYRCRAVLLAEPWTRAKEAKEPELESGFLAGGPMVLRVGQNGGTREALEPFIRCLQDGPA